MLLICEVVYFRNFNQFYVNDNNTTSIVVPQISWKTGKQWHSKGNTELYCLFIAADSIVDAISCSVIRKQVLHKSGSGQIWVAKSGQVWLWPDLK